MKYQHLFFDLDRTLWHFEKNSQETLEEIIGALNLTDRGIGTLELIETYRKINHECWSLYRKGLMEKEELRTVRFRRTLAHYGVQDVSMADHLANAYVERSPTKTHLCEGTIPMLDYLQNKGYVMHIITNGFPEVQYIKLENSGLKKYFDEIIVSEEVGHKKPHIEVFSAALFSASANKSESIVIGDDLEADIGGARNAGIDQVYYNPDEIPHGEETTYEIKHLVEIHNIL